MPDSTSFAKLNETNYHEWRILMEALLIKRGYWEIVEGTLTMPVGSVNHKTVQAFIRRRNEAYAELVLHVEPPQLAHITGRDPKVVWDTLANLHQSQGFSSRFALRRRFTTMRKSDTQSMQSWIGDVRRLAFQLDQSGVHVTEEDTILVLTTGLPLSYANLIVTFDAVEPSILTLHYVITRLLNEESRQCIDAAIPSVQSPLPNSEALVSTSISTPRKKDSSLRIMCFNCGKKGHYKSNCPDLKSAGVAEENDSGEDFAF